MGRGSKVVQYLLRVKGKAEAQQVLDTLKAVDRWRDSGREGVDLKRSLRIVVMILRIHVGAASCGRMCGTRGGSMQSV